MIEPVSLAAPTPALVECGLEGHTAEAKLAHARRSLHELNQVLALLVGTAELAGLSPEVAADVGMVLGSLPRLRQRLVDCLTALHDALSEEEEGPRWTA
ncbi:MAG TPA: hypothetical protein VNM50_06555 [Chloroflexota bacterium]|nr:hypothetical protein [Chloroflexota bacterium]